MDSGKKEELDECTCGAIYLVGTLKRTGEFMSAGIVATQMIIIFLFMIIGYVLTQKGKFSQTTASDMSFLIINICCPAMMLSGVLTDQSITPQHLIQMGIVVVLAYAFLILFAILIGSLLRVKKDQRKHYKLMTVFGNIGFIGYPVINAVIGSGGMPYAALFNLGFNLLVFTYGIIVLNQNTEGEKQKLQWKKLINVGTISGVVAILALIFKPTVPTAVLNCLDYLGSIMTFMTVAIIGHTLAFIPLKQVFREKRIYLFVLLRSVLVPIAVGFVMKQFVHDETMINVTMLLMAMPVANMPLMLAQQAGQETETLTKGIVLSTTLSIITITLVTTVVTLL